MSIVRCMRVIVSVAVELVIFMNKFNMDNSRDSKGRTLALGDNNLACFRIRHLK